MPLSSGDQLGPYEIIEPIGAGGMGEVYRARDPRVGREVAIKVSNAQFTERFDREARAVAALNHPNICTLFDVGASPSGAGYLVMELVDGPTVADRIKEGPVPLEEALSIARQIADALEAAHNRAIVHRDLKPGNIKLRHDGTVKVLDFGLAKTNPSQSRDREGAVNENSPTLTIGMTEAGAILGTAAYMSPEQARGRPVDKRADIWSFGVVLYEMLTGERLFQGEDVLETLAAVVHKQPDLSKVPAQVRPLLERCLEKDPKKRLRDISGLEFLLAPATPTAERSAPAARRHSWFWPSVAAFIALALMPANILHFREQPPQQQILQYTLAAPEKAGNIQQFAISPDGHYLVMRIIGTNGPGLWVRAMDSLQAKMLPGTNGGDYPFWSPDSRYIGFFADGKLKKISANGGPAQILCNAPTARGGAWNQDGVILFTPVNNAGLSQVSAAGGVPAIVTKVTNGTHRNPTFLPDGRRFLVAASGADTGIYLGSIDGKEAFRRLLGDVSYAAYFNGQLLFVRDATLMAQPIDLKTMEFKGDLFPVAEHISPGRNPSDQLFSVSANGILVYESGGAAQTRQHVWKDRTGKDLGPAGGIMPAVNNLALSPDGKRFVSVRLTSERRIADLWITDLEHSTDSRLTTDTSINQYPVWSPDGSKVLFDSDRSGTENLYQRASNGTGQDELLLESKELKVPWDWSRDGRFIVYMVRTMTDDIWVLPTTGDKKPFPLLQSEFAKRQAQISPDERWLAYTSVESGRFEIYVVPFTPAAKPDAKPVVGKWPISTLGGTQPRWRPDGKELFYVGMDGKLMAVEIKATATAFDHGAPQALFELRSDIPALNNMQFGYAPAPDGKRFLVSTAPGTQAEAPPLTVVVNWLAGVKK